MTWSRLAPQTCQGPATSSWTAKADEASLATGTAGRKHCIVVSDPIFWCVTCGAFAETAPKLLATSCRGKHEGK